MSHQIRGFFKRITGDQASYDALAKQPITDAETKLKLFNDATSVSIAGVESYLKSVSKLIDQTLGERFNESKELFAKYDKPNDQIYGTVLGKLSLIQNEMNNDVNDFIRNIEFYVLKPLNDYQEEVKIVKDNKKELKEAYDRIEQCRQNLEKHKKESESAHRTNKSNDFLKFEDKVVRSEKELDEATSTANEKYDKYTETLYKKISEECELSNNYINYLNAQRKFHKRALKKLDLLIPDVDEAIHNYYKKPVFGSDLEEYVERSQKPGGNEKVSPVIKKLIHSMYAQNAFSEEGIFRIAGSRVKMNCLLNAINAGYLDYLDTTNDFDVHCLAGVLKQYIRELPDSLLCNEHYEDWIEAINTNQMPNKLEAYRRVLDKLPKVNYENIRYLIKFLAKVVENSEKTKMTTSNMGICFGVSLLSNNGPLNNNKSELKVIDMATATNVFDFLLTNHSDLFQEDIDFSGVIKKGANPNYSTLSKATGSAISKDLNEQAHTSNFTSSFNKITESPVVNKLGFVTQDNQEDSFNELHGNHMNSSPYPRGINSNAFNSSSPMVGNSITNTNRTIKKNYFENRNTDNNSEMFASNNSINSVGSINNANGFNNANKSLSSPSQNSADPGSVSPRRERSKKMAPAPPPIPRKHPNNDALNDSANPFLNPGIVTEIQTTPPKIPSNTPTQSASNSTASSLIQAVAPDSVSSGQSLNNTVASNEISKQTQMIPKLSTNSNAASTYALKTNQETNESSPTISPSQPINQVIKLEKPTQPPPSIPNRPPPIGFNLSGIQLESNFNETHLNNKLASNSNSTLLSSSTSSTVSSSSQEILNSTNTNNKNSCQNQNQLTTQGTNQTKNQNANQTTAPAKGPKPAVPRRPGNMIAAHIKQFDQSIENNSPQTPPSVPKSSSEITSL